MANLPNRLREWREAKGMSQQELANLVGCSKVQISGLERGKPRIDIYWMEQISAALGIDPVLLLNSSKDGIAAQTEQERALLDRFRHADPAAQDSLLSVAESLARYAA